MTIDQLALNELLQHRDERYRKIAQEVRYLRTTIAAQETEIRELIKRNVKLQDEVNKAVSARGWENDISKWGG